jgi:hypothetical protein
MKCNKCGAEWQLPAGSCLTAVCPFCGTPVTLTHTGKLSLEGALTEIISQFGIETMRDSRQLNAILSDFAPGLKKERTLLSAFYACGGKQLLDVSLDANEYLSAKNKIGMRMENEWGTSEENANYVCDSFFAAVGGIIPKEKKNPDKTKAFPNNSFDMPGFTAGTCGQTRTDTKGQKHIKHAPLYALLVIIMLLIAAVIIIRGNNQYANSNISSIPVESAETDIWLTQLDPLKKAKEIRESSSGTYSTNTGSSFSNYISATKPGSEVVYSLGGQYKHLSATWAITAEDKDDEFSSSFDLYKDGELVYKSPAITAGDTPVSVDVDISGCKILTIIFMQGRGQAVLADVKLTGDASASTESNTAALSDSVLPCWLTELDYLDKDDYIGYTNNSDFTNTGEEVSHYIDSKYDDRSIEYFLDGKYQKLSGLWTLTENGKNAVGPYCFEILCDGKVAYTSPEISAGDEPVPFSVDISGCKKLKVHFISAGSDSYLMAVTLVANLLLS